MAWSGRPGGADPTRTAGPVYLRRPEHEPVAGLLGQSDNAMSSDPRLAGDVCHGDPRPTCTTSTTRRPTTPDFGARVTPVACVRGNHRSTGDCPQGPLAASRARSHARHPEFGRVAPNRAGRRTTFAALASGEARHIGRPVRVHHDLQHRSPLRCEDAGTPAYGLSPGPPCRRVRTGRECARGR